MNKFRIVVAILFVAAPTLRAQAEEGQKILNGREGQDLSIRLFRPRGELKVSQHHLNRAKFPVVDVHSHLRFKLPRAYADLDHFVQVMDRNNIAVNISLDGGLGERLTEHLEFVGKDHPDRCLVFANVDWVGDGDREDPASWACHRTDFARHIVTLLSQAKREGVSGLKLFKQFGLGYKNPDGSLLQIDDLRWDPIWRACGELGLPVIIHVADPAAFFRPIDETNERWEELYRHPDWSFEGPEFPEREALLAARNRVIARHPETVFIGAHVANNAEDLQTVGQWIETYPNFYVEIASRISELGRQPYTARKFFLKYSDRILFGTDGPWPEQRLSLYWRFLETFDEYFPYSEKEFPPQGFWRIYGIGLPDDVLCKIYHENAARIIPGVSERLANRKD